MKQLLIKITDELDSKLRTIPNKSDFVRQAIEEKLEGKLQPSVDSSGITREEVIELIKLHSISSEPKPFVPMPPDPHTGYPCCEGKKPCKHWIWDSGLTCYVNTITGKQKEIESTVDVTDL